MSDPFAPIAAGAKQAAAAKPKGSNIVPVPADAPPPPAEHPTLGKPSAIWRYTDAGGRLLGFACRFDGASDKQFRPLTFWRPPSGAPCWRWESWPEKRPLYGLQKLAERPRAPVLICEGEKAADAAAQLLPDFVTVTSPNGSKSARMADWSPLRARRIVIWPDADAAGTQYMRALAQLVGVAAAAFVASTKGRGRGATVMVVRPPGDCAEGWDAADALREGWTRRADRRGGATGRDCRR
jgi:putative DNA primase/helicase